MTVPFPSSLSVVSDVELFCCEPLALGEINLAPMMMAQAMEVGVWCGMAKTMARLEPPPALSRSPWAIGPSNVVTPRSYVRPRAPSSNALVSSDARSL